MAESSLHRKPPKLLSKHNYRFKGILCLDPDSAWKFCAELQTKWKAEYSKDTELVKCMERWKESKSLHLVWVSDKFGGTLSNDVSEKRTYLLLTQLYKELREQFDDDSLKRITDDLHSTVDNGTDDATNSVSLPAMCTTLKRDRNAEKDRTSELQLKQHLEALIFLSKSAEVGTSLSENLIKAAHKLLMRGLHTSDKLEIHAGGYRTCSVSAGDHVYPHYDTILKSMSMMVKKYNDHQKNQEHDPFELASWLLLEFLTIHPFEDGNGRISRLLWCYSLMLDGLPFPLTPFPGIKKAYKQYVACVENDRAMVSFTSAADTTSCVHTTSLTVISVTKIWMNFISNLRQESPEKHEQLVLWVKSREVNLVPITK